MADARVILQRRPEGQVGIADFAVVPVEIAPLAAGEALVAPARISLDPYLAIQVYGRPVRGVTLEPGEAMRSRMVGTVVESRDPSLAPGDMVRGVGPWQSRFAIPAAQLERLDTLRDRPELHLSALGTSGITAWVGLHRVARIAPGETLIVSGATGTIGSIVGQLGRRHGCDVIGIAGGAEKCAHATGALGFERCLDHRSESFGESLCGIEAQVHFENVGGALLDAVLPAITEHGRIALCGMVAHYDTSRAHSFRNLHLLLEKVIELRPYRVSEHAASHAEALRDLRAAVEAGELTCDHTFADGLDAAAAGFVSMLQGKALGKSIVRLDGREA
mgnify:CR=1 FL=1